MAAKENRKRERSEISIPTNGVVSLEFSILSYVPRATDEDGINIAVLVAGEGFAEAKHSCIASFSAL